MNCSKGTKIKICGLKRPEDIECINFLKPDYTGFVFFEKSIRYISMEEAAKLKKLLSPEIKAVGVFLDNELELVNELAEGNIIDMIQLHGNKMGEDFIAKLRKVTDKPIIRAFTVESAEDVQKARECTADYVLLDSGKGGTGQTFDWNCIKDIQRPYFLAGGLNPENVAEAIKRFHPYAVDVSSGVEGEKVKDAEKIARFISQVKNANT